MKSFTWNEIISVGTKWPFWGIKVFHLVQLFQYCLYDQSLLDKKSSFNNVSEIPSVGPGTKHPGLM